MLLSLHYAVKTRKRFLPQSLIVLLTLVVAAIRVPSPVTSLQMSNRVKLSYRQNQIDNNQNPPLAVNNVPTLLIHGLDSSSHTWRGIIEKLKTPAVAIDIRGCGYSDLGDPNEFSPDAIVEDIHEFVSNHEYFQSSETRKTAEGKEEREGGIQKFVVCGHSMVRL